VRFGDTLHWRLSSLEAFVTEAEDEDPLPLEEVGVLRLDKYQSKTLDYEVSMYIRQWLISLLYRSLDFDDIWISLIKNDFTMSWVISEGWFMPANSKNKKKREQAFLI